MGRRLAPYEPAALESGGEVGPLPEEGDAPLASFNR